MSSIDRSLLTLQSFEHVDAVAAEQAARDVTDAFLKQDNLPPIVLPKNDVNKL